MRKMFIALTVIVTSLTGLAFSSDNGFFNADKAFKSGIDQYNSADYPGAAESFSSIIDHGLKSGNVYFNLGNCRLKEGKIGQAILSFERARLFIPRDRDLVSNIGIARELIKQKETAPNKFLLSQSLDIAVSYVTIKEAVFLIFFIYLAFFAMAIFCVFFHRARAYLIPLMILAAAFLAVLSPSLYKKIVDTKRSGIVVAPIIDARYAPEELAPAHFPAYEGMKVSILSTQDDWRKIKRGDGKIGWVPRSAVEPILE